jgi:hypothetical protein
MPVRIRVLQAAKPGNQPDENEDACKYHLHSNAPKKTKRVRFNPLLTVAVSDGATMSPFSSLWARLLAERYVRTPFATSKGAKRNIAQAGETWKAEVNRKKLEWYIEYAPKLGSNATLLGIQFFTAGKWKAFAVGDTCLFQIRKNKCIGTFPIHNAEEFGNTPPLISTHIPRNNATKIWNRATTVDSARWSSWRIGDVFLLATDAMAHWIMETASLTENSWEEIFHLWSEDQQAEKGIFENFVTLQREAGKMTEDDTTLVMVRFDEQ